MSTDDDIQFPVDDRPSKINRQRRSEAPEDVTSAADRIDAFWQKHPDGSILTEVETTVVEAANVLPYLVFTVRAFVRKRSDDDRPSATAHATRGQNDEDELVRQFPQETAETAAISRAIRNIGVLTGTTKASPPPTEVTTPTEPTASPVAVAREAAGLSQKQLAEMMRAEGIAWSQAVVSKVERGSRALRPTEATVLGRLIAFTDGAPT